MKAGYKKYQKWFPVILMLVLLPLFSFAQAISGPAGVCENQVGTGFFTSNPGPGFNWTVVGGNITAGAGSNFIQVDWGSAGSGSVILQTTGTMPITDTFQVSIRPYPNPNIVGPDTVCKNTNGQSFFVPNDPALSYSWAVSGGTVPGPLDQASVAVDWPNVGSGTVGLTVNDTLAGCQGTDLQNITILDLPATGLGADFTVCPDVNPVLNGGPYPLVVWSTGDSTRLLTVTHPGTYTVQVTDQYGCMNADTVVISHFPLAQNFILDSGATPACLGDTLTLYCVDTFNTYQWSSGSLQPQIEVSSSGWYGVFATDSRGCTSEDSVEITILPVPKPAPVIEPEGPWWLCGDSLLLETGSGYSSYFWSTGSSGDSLWVENPGIYFVEVTNGFGCRGQSNLVEVNDGGGIVASLSQNLDSLVAQPAGGIYNWFYNGFPLPGYSTQSILPPFDGSYQVEVLDSNGCSDLSDSLIFTSTGIGILSEETVTIFPNPADQFLKIEYPVSQTVLLRIVNPEGKVLKEEESAKGEFQFPVGELPNGIYFLEIRDQEDGKTFRKILIQHP